MNANRHVLNLKWSVTAAAVPSERWQTFRANAARIWLLCLSFLTISLGCATPTPRVLEVSHRERLNTVEETEEDVFIQDRASHIKVKSQPLPKEEQRQEFYVRWNDRDIQKVKLEYRQLNTPNQIKEQVHDSNGDRSTMFIIQGDEYHQGGKVSAWRVSLWQDDSAPVAEMKSVLW